MPPAACKNPLPNSVGCKTALMLFQTSQTDKMHPNNYSWGPQGCSLRPSVMWCLRGWNPSVTLAKGSWGWGQVFDLLCSSAGAHQNDSCSKNQTLSLSLSYYGTNFNMLLETLGQHFGVENQNKCLYSAPVQWSDNCPSDSAWSNTVTRAHFQEHFIAVDAHGCRFSQWGLRDKMFSGATARSETNRRCRGSSATGCLKAGIKDIEGIQNEDILTNLLLNYL